MGKLGRFACIFVPMALSIASLLCLMFVFLGGLNKNESSLRSLYYFRADTSKFKANATSGLLKGTGIDQNLLDALVGQVKANNLKDFYEIYMWNYCSGTKNGTTNGTETITYCSPRTAKFYFNPVQEWGLNGTALQKYIPGAVNTALSTYKKVAAWQFIAYTVAFWATVGTIVVGLFAICSRVGSCVTTLVSGAATLFTILAAVTSTILFSTLVASLNTALAPYQIHSSVGTKMLAVDWLAVAFSVGASLFWFVSICCCSGRSSRKDARSAKAVSTYSGPWGGQHHNYQPLADANHPTPYGGPGHRGVEMQDMGASPYKGREGAYEPFRHERVV